MNDRDLTMTGWTMGTRRGEGVTSRWSCAIDQPPNHWSSVNHDIEKTADDCAQGECKQIIQSCTDKVKPATVIAERSRERLCVLLLRYFFGAFGKTGQPGRL